MCAAHSAEFTLFCLTKYRYVIKLYFLGYIAQLKSKYFENKDPIDDNEIVLQKLCVKLEIALRHGMKGKHFKFLFLKKGHENDQI